MTSHFIVAATALASLLGAPVAAQPAPASGHRDLARETVRYAPSEAISPEGAKRIALRIQIAAERVCGGNNVLVRTGGNFGLCRRDAIERAAATLGAPFVTQALRGDPMLAQR